jgi:hypothetical protein
MRPRPLRRHSDGFAARPALRPLIAVEVRIRIGVARSFILAICVRIELRAIAGFGNHRLRGNRRDDRGRQNSHHAKEPRARHCVFSSAVESLCGYTENNTSAAALFHDVGDPSTVKPFAAALSASVFAPHESGNGTFRTWRNVRSESAMRCKDGVIGRPSLWIAEDFRCCASG